MARRGDAICRGSISSKGKHLFIAQGRKGTRRIKWLTKEDQVRGKETGHSIWHLAAQHMVVVEHPFANIERFVRSLSGFRRTKHYRTNIRTNSIAICWFANSTPSKRSLVITAPNTTSNTFSSSLEQGLGQRNFKES